ncbi:hypothetical protein [Streptomyces sp. NPDC002540]
MTTARCSATGVKVICRCISSWSIAGAVLDHPAVGAQQLTAFQQRSRPTSAG